MNYKLTKSRTLNWEFAIYTIMFVMISLLIYRMNDKTRPLIGILDPGYLIPCALYSAFVILISLSFFRILKTIIQKPWALGIALFLGIPIGIYILFQLTNWLFK